MKIIDDKTIGLSREEAHCLIRPSVSGGDTYAFSDYMHLKCDKPGQKDVEIDSSDLDRYGGLNFDWTNFHIEFGSDEDMQREMKYLKQCLERNGFVLYHKSWLTRLGDIRQECLLFLQEKGLASNIYGNVRPGILDLWSIDYNVSYEYAGNIVENRVVAIVQPLNKLIVETSDKAYGYVDIDYLDIYELARLCDEIKSAHLSSTLLHVGVFSKLEEYISFLESLRVHFAEGEKARYVIWNIQDDGTYKRCDYGVVTVIKEKEHSVIIERTNEYGVWQESASLMNVHKI